MLNKYLHLISIKERGEGGGAKDRPGNTSASDHLLLSVSPAVRWGHFIMLCSQRAVPMSSTF